MPDVDDIAIGWAVQIDAHPLDNAAAQALAAWLAEDPRHRGALFRAQAGLAVIDGAGAVDGKRALRLARPSRRQAVGLALAASLVAMLAVPWALKGGEDYRTDIGEIRRIALADGSLAVVNTRSNLEVRYEDSARHLLLNEGEAWFKVAKNRERPFIVDAADVHVRATGTAFSVRRRKDAVDVVVTEGTVLVWRGDRTETATRVSAGNAARIDVAATKAAARTAPIGRHDPLAWREGGLSLDETTVFEAASEFNRYNRAQIEVANPAIGNQPMTGYFQINRPDAFSDAVSEVTGARVSNKGNTIVIE
jgi:transmembrane sensor